MSSRIKITDTRTLSHNWGRLNEYTLDYQRSDGGWQNLRREVYDHGHAAAVLLHDPDSDRVVLVRQFRLPAHLNGANGWLLECCAGLLDADDPETCVRREALEETGITVGPLSRAFSSIVSPGSLTETVHLFVGEYDPQSRTHQGGGLAREGEDIEVVEMPFNEAFSLIASGGITDAKTIMLLQHLALMRA